MSMVELTLETILLEDEAMGMYKKMTTSSSRKNNMLPENKVMVFMKPLRLLRYWVK